MQGSYWTQLETSFNDRYPQFTSPQATELLREAWREVIKKEGISFFTEEVLGFENVPHQRECYSILDNKGLKKIATAAPRGHTKFTCFTVNYSLERIDEDHNIRISSPTPRAKDKRSCAISSGTSSVTRLTSPSQAP